MTESYKVVKRNDGEFVLEAFDLNDDPVREVKFEGKTYPSIEAAVKSARKLVPGVRWDCGDDDDE